jgi:dTDP-4-amino-4,6-dideoxygalactose transaminase
MGDFMTRPKEQIGVGAIRISDQEKAYVNEALDSNRLSYGPFSKRLENDFAREHDCKYCVVTNSGTSSLHVAVMAVKEKYGWADGDEVLCPAATFVASSNMILDSRLTPVFVDVEPGSYNIDPRQLERHITARTRGIMVVHLYGQPADMDPILEVAARHGLRIIEDSAETMFARYKGKCVGSFGDVGCFSTYACHILVTGVGGLTTTNDADTAMILRSLVNHGRDNIYISMDDDREKHGAALQEIISRRFKFVRGGYSYRITELEAALGCGQLEAAEQNLRRRKAIAQALLGGLDKWAAYLDLPHPQPNRDHVYMVFPLLIKEDAGFTRSEITLFLEERMIETRPMVSILDQPYYQKLFGTDIEDRYPVARRIARDGFYVGCHPEMDDEIVEYVLGTFDEFFASRSAK